MLRYVPWSFFQDPHSLGSLQSVTPTLRVVVGSLGLLFTGNDLSNKPSWGPSISQLPLASMCIQTVLQTLVLSNSFPTHSPICVSTPLVGTPSQVVHAHTGLGKPCTNISSC